MPPDTPYDRLMRRLGGEAPPPPEQSEETPFDRLMRKFEKPSQIVWKKTAEDLAEIPDTRPAEKTYREQMRAVTDPTARRHIRAEAEGPLATFEHLRTARQEAAARVRAEDAELARMVRHPALEAARETGSQPPVGGIAGGVADVLAAPQQYGVIRPLRKLIGTGQHEYGEEYPFTKFATDVRETAEKDPGWRGAVAKAALVPAKLVGKPAGALLGAIPAGVGALSDVPAIYRELKDPEKIAGLLRTGTTPQLTQSGENIRQTVRDTQKDVEDFALGAYTDPLTFLPVGKLGEGVTGGVGKATETLLGHSTPGYAAAKTMTRQAKGARAVGEAKSLGELDTLMRELPPGHKLWEAKTREAIMDRHQDPGFEIPQLATQMEMFPGASRAVRRPETIAPYEGHAAMPQQAELFAAPTPKTTPYLGETPTTKDYGGPLNAPVREQFNAIPEFGKTFRYHADELGSMRPVVPRPDYVPAEQLDQTFGPGAAKYAEGSRRFNEKWLGELLESGALTPGQVAYNPLSLQYHHRINEPVVGGLQTTVEQNLRPATGGTSFTKPRVTFNDVRGGLSPDTLPAYARKGERDFLAVAPEYARQAARATAQANLEDKIIAAFGREPTTGAGSGLKQGWKLVQTAKGPRELPADIYNLTAGTFDRSASTIGRALTPMIGHTPAGRAVLHVLNVGTWADNRFKQMVLRTGGYLAMNATDDSMRSVLSGNVKLPIYLQKASRIIEGARIGSPPQIELAGARRSGADILLEAQRENIAVGAAERFEHESTIAGKRSLEETARMSAGKRPSIGAIYRKYAPAELGGEDRISEAAQAWEVRMKLAHYLWRRDLGDSPAKAAEHTLSILIDYTNRNKAEQIAGWFLPFLKFAEQAPIIAAKTALEHPGAVSNLNRGLAIVQGENELERPESLRERGYTLGASKRGREVIGGLRQLLGGSPAHAGTEMALLPRFSATDAYQPVSELFRGNIGPAGQAFGPVPKAAIEAVAGTDLFTKKPLAPPTTGLVPAGTPLAPTGLQANADQAAWSRYIAPFMASPIGLTLINQAINELQGGKGNLATFGAQRPYAPEKSPRDVFAHTYMSQLFGLRPYEVTPADALKNRAYSSEVRAALGNAAEAKKRAKAERRR